MEFLIYRRQLRDASSFSTARTMLGAGWFVAVACAAYAVWLTAQLRIGAVGGFVTAAAILFAYGFFFALAEAVFDLADIELERSWRESNARDEVAAAAAAECAK